MPAASANELTATFQRDVGPSAMEPQSTHPTGCGSRRRAQLLTSTVFPEPAGALTSTT